MKKILFVAGVAFFIATGFAKNIEYTPITIQQNLNEYKDNIKKIKEKRLEKENRLRISDNYRKIREEAERLEKERLEKLEQEKLEKVEKEKLEKKIEQERLEHKKQETISYHNNQDSTTEDYISYSSANVENLHATATNGCDIYYSKITGKEPQITMGSAFSVPDMARNVGATVAINAGMGYENGGIYYAYGDLYNSYSGHQSGDTLVLRNNGWLDDCWVDSGNVTTLGVKWAVKGLNCYTYNGQHTGYADCGSNPYSFIAQDYAGVYYIGAFSNASFSTMHESLKRVIPDLKFMYATEGGGMVKYVENGNLIFNGRGQDYRYSNAMIWF